MVQDQNGDSEQMEIECGQYQDPPVKIARDPGAPTEQEVEEHNATHLPHRSWCPVCVKARSKEDPHDKKKKQKDKEGKPIVAMDYKTLGEEADEDDKITMMVIKDEASGCVAAHVCSQKGASDQWLVSRICDDLDMFGHTEIVLKSDGEPAIVQVQNAVKGTRNHPTICQNPPAYDPQANGSAERAVQEVTNQIKAMKIGLQYRIGAQITTEWKIMEWIVELASVLLNRCLIGKDGKTAYARLMGRNSTKQIVEIGERVLAKIARGPGSRKRALRTRWEDAIWVGVAKKSNEHIVVLEGGGQALRCRTIKRRPVSDRWSSKGIVEIKATPRRPNPKDPDEEDVQAETEPQVKEVKREERIERPEPIPPRELKRRNFRITQKLLEKYGHSPNCEGCEAALGGRRPREHTADCRSRLEASMELDPEDSQRIRQRDERAYAPQPEEPREARKEQEEARQEATEQRVPEPERPERVDEEMAGAEDVLYGAREDEEKRRDEDDDERDPDAGPSGINRESGPGNPEPAEAAKRETPESDSWDELAQKIKRRRLQAIIDQADELSKRLGMNKYDGGKQTLRKMLASMTKEKGGQHEERTVDITKVMETIQNKVQEYENQGMSSPHEDKQWEEMYSGIAFYDDVNGGQRLDKRKVIQARRLEMQFFKKMGVYSKVSKSEVKKAGGKIISTKWVDTDKGDGKYRSRLVGRELKFDNRQDLFSPTPPLETLKVLIAKCAKGQWGAKPLRIGGFDISRAYFYAACRRPLYIKIPDEDWEPGDEERVGKLNVSLYGTRDAAQNWAAAYTEYLVKLGFRQGRASLCNFVHEKRNIALTVHGDDFLVVADLAQMKWLEKQLKDQYETKSTIIGPEPELAKELQILNRTLRWNENDIEYEADPKHARMIIEECEVASCRPSKTPGVAEKPKAPQEETATEKLGAKETTKFRALAARINYLAQDRADLQFTAKDISRKMASPTTEDWERVRRLARYLKLKPRAVQKFRFEDSDDQIRGYADSDWAGERVSMKSTSGGAVMWGSSLLKSWSTTQATVALSSGEAELYALSRCAQMLMAIRSTAADFLMDLKITAYSDSTAAIGITYRCGLGGRTRHVKVQYLWIQGAVTRKDLQIRKVGTIENPADLMTKYLDGEGFARHSRFLGYYFPEMSRCKLERDAKDLAQLERCRLFAKHLALARQFCDSIPVGVASEGGCRDGAVAQCRSEHIP